MRLVIFGNYQKKGFGYYKTICSDREYGHHLYIPIKGEAERIIIILVCISFILLVRTRFDFNLFQSYISYKLVGIF